MNLIKKTGMILCLAIFTTWCFNTPTFADDANKMVNELWKEPSVTDEEQKAESISDEEKIENDTTGVTFFDLIRTAVATVFVIAMLLFLLKFINKKSRAYQSGNIIKNLGGTNLGSNKSIQVVRIGEQLFIVGVGENVQLLKEITEPEDRKRILEEYNQSVDQSLVSTDIFSKLLDRKKEGTPFIEQFKKQLEDSMAYRKQLRTDLKKKEKQEDE